jgi:uncharacterized repeat protein (TIGR03803 family)
MAFDRTGAHTRPDLHLSFNSEDNFMKFRIWMWMSVMNLFATLVLAPVAIQSAQAQTYQVIYNFTGGQDGKQPEAGLTIDQAGRLYGTTLQGGNTGGSCGANGCGTVFRLEPQGASWTLKPLYNFQGGADGSFPYARVIFGPDGSLYGTTAGGGTNGLGTVFNLRPFAGVCKSALCPWKETVIHSFGGADGRAPDAEVVFDQAGNMYGTTSEGGTYGGGTVFELMPQTGGGWTEKVLYSFMGGSDDGANPASGLIFDQSGNLWGTTLGGGYSSGTVYQLTPSGGGWQENFLHKFQYMGDGASPKGGLVLDNSGGLYGTTAAGELERGYYGGTLFQITGSNGRWRLTTQCDFWGWGYYQNVPGPEASLAIGPTGSLYGTTFTYPTGYGSVFEGCSPVHDFTGGADGANPISNVVFDRNGHLYGTTLNGGADGGGTVWEITP